MTRAFIPAVLLAAAALAVAPAAGFEDVVTRLRVEPPAPLTAEKISNINFAGAIGIRSPAGSPQPAPPNEFLCQVGYAPRPIQATQAEINAQMLDPTAIAGVAASLESEFETYESATFTANGVAGFEFFATPKTDAATRLYTTLMQTTKGLVQQHCTTTAGDADAALVLFRAIRDTIVPP